MTPGELEQIHHWGVVALFVTAAVAFPALFFVTVPYGGRHKSERWGPGIPARISWALQEAPAPVCFALAYAQGPLRGDPVAILFLLLFAAHYLNRTIVYPLRMRATGRRDPLGATALAFSFNVINGVTNGLAVSGAGGGAGVSPSALHLWLGLLLFVVGAGINLHADAILRRLRRPGEAGYAIPHGGLFRRVSNPSYLGEIIQWLGWAIATWTAAGLGFAVVTTANLVPRARDNHRWYRRTFADYPPERHALLPSLW